MFNQIRGLSPWPVAYTTMDDTNLQIYDAELVETNKINEPGTIIETTKKAIIVATHDNEAVAIKEIPFEDQKDNPMDGNSLGGYINNDSK